MLKVSVGLAHGEDSYAVGVNATHDAVSGLGGIVPGLVIAFASSRYDQSQILAGIRTVSKDALVVGSSTAGEITGAGPATRNALVVMVVASSDVTFFAGVGENIVANPRAAGAAAAAAVKAQSASPLSALIMFPDSLSGDGSEIVGGIVESLAEHIPVFGGSSGDELQFQKTYQYMNDKVYSGAVVALGFVGPVKIGIGARHGWIPIGLPLQVTRAEGALLRELDGKPAISIYEDYFGNELTEELKTENTFASVALTYPLGIRLTESHERLIRNPLKVNADGSLVCSAGIPEGAEVQLMLGSREEAVKAAREAAKKAVADFGTGAAPAAAFVLSSASRKKLFGEHAGDEVRAIQEMVGANLPLIGLYTYGEQAPLQSDEKSAAVSGPVFQSETAVVAVIG